MSIRALLVRVARRPWLVVLVVACMACQAAFSLAFSLASRSIFDDVLPHRDAGLLASIAVAMTAAIVIRVGVVLLQERYTARLAAQVLTSFRTDMFVKLHHLPPAYFAGRSAGDTLALFSSDVGAVDMMVSRLLPRAANLSLRIIACGGLMFVLDRRLALAAVVALLLALLVPRSLVRRTSRGNANRRATEASLLADVQENLALRSIVRFFGLQGWARDRHAQGLTEFNRNVQNTVYAAGMLESSMILTLSGIQLLMLFGGAYIATTGGLSAGKLVAFTALFATVAASVFGLSQEVPSLIEAASAFTEQPIFSRPNRPPRRGTPPNAWRVFSAAFVLNT